jgi:hypothetical protein
VHGTDLSERIATLGRVELDNPPRIGGYVFDDADLRFDGRRLGGQINEPILQRLGCAIRVHVTVLIFILCKVG